MRGETRTPEFLTKNPNGRNPTPERVHRERALFAEKQQRGYQALEVMEAHLAKRKFFVAEHYSIADIALYAYTRVAHEGGFDLERFPNVRKWLDRVRSQVNYIP